MTPSEKLDKSGRLIKEYKLFDATARRKLAEAKEAGARATALLAEATALLAEVRGEIVLEGEE